MKIGATKGHQIDGQEVAKNQNVWKVATRRSQNKKKSLIIAISIWEVGPISSGSPTTHGLGHRYREWSVEHHMAYIQTYLKAL